MPADKPFLIAGLCLLIGCTALGQDVFNSTGDGVSPCQQARAAEGRIYAERRAALQKKENDLSRQEERERTSCRGDASCLAAASRDAEERIRLLNLEGQDEAARHEKAIVDVDHSSACSAPRQAADTPCDLMRAGEQRRYELAMAGLKKNEIDNRNRFEHESSDCRGSAACLTAATGRQSGRIQEINRRTAEEGARRDRVLAEVDRGRCSLRSVEVSTLPQLKPIVTNPENLAEINCPTCKCVDLKTSRLMVDQQLKALAPDSYNCFFYAKSFIEGRRHTLEAPEAAHGESWADPNYVYGKGYDLVAFGSNINFVKAQLGDIVAVEGDNFPLSYRPWVHIGIVTEADANGKIYSIRQKPDGSHCVVDLTLDDFYKVYPVSGNYRYMVYRSRSNPGTLPKANWQQAGIYP